MCSITLHRAADLLSLLISITSLGQVLAQAEATNPSSATFTSHWQDSEHSISEENHAQSRYHPLRLELMDVVLSMLSPTNIAIVAESGTLLGAWRNGLMIPQEDDIDFAVIGRPHFDMLRGVLESGALPNPYKWREVTSYCEKFEIYDPRYGSRWLDKSAGVDFHHVTLDFTSFAQHPTEPLAFQHRHFKVAGALERKYMSEDIFPISSMAFAGHRVPVPHNTESFLIELYGYLGNDAVFNKTIGLYAPRAQLHEMALEL